MAELATPEDLAAYLGTPPSNPDQASFALDAASALVRGYCRWSITRDTDAVWTLDGQGGRLLALPTLHLVDVRAVVVRGKPVTDAEPAEAGMLYRRAGWPRGFGAIEVRAAHGYDPVPRDIVAVVCSLAGRVLSMASLSGVSSYRVGGVQITYGRDGTDATAFTLAERLALDRHRLWDAG